MGAEEREQKESLAEMAGLYRKEKLGEGKPMSGGSLR